MINYPDIGSWIARLMGRSWVFLLDVHLYYFTRATIRKLLEDAGIRSRPHSAALSASGARIHAASRVAVCRRSPRAWSERLLRSMGLAEWQVPYWMGQTLVVARKRATIN